jgi:hypothetical protein
MVLSLASGILLGLATEESSGKRNEHRNNMLSVYSKNSRKRQQPVCGML